MAKVPSKTYEPNLNESGRGLSLSLSHSLQMFSIKVQSLGLRPGDQKLAGTVKQNGGYNFYIKGKNKQQNSSLSNQVHNSPFLFFSNLLFVIFCRTLLHSWLQQVMLQLAKI